MIRTPLRAIGAALVLAALLLASCSTSGSDDAKDTTTTAADDEDARDITLSGSGRAWAERWSRIEAATEEYAC